ncbi:MAG: GDP-mannose 4,6-dehydratase [Oligoflexia bacterium]|nr:GDP-mannose 4,6-dehydratase [Oligoflexia bacterium]
MGKVKMFSDWIHVEDHCEGILLALLKGKPGQTYCLGGNSEKKNIDLVHLICETLDLLKPSSSKKSYKEQISFVTDRLGHDLRYAIDDTKAQQELGFQRKHKFELGIKTTIEWYINNQDWCNEVLKESRS